MRVTHQIGLDFDVFLGSNFAVADIRQRLGDLVGGTKSIIGYKGGAGIRDVGFNNQGIGSVEFIEKNVRKWKHVFSSHMNTTNNMQLKIF